MIGSLAELRERALDPRDCGVHEPQFYAAHSSATPFSEDMPIRWVEGYSLTERRTILVPTQLVYYGRTEDEARFVFSNSNGCATGTSLEEAILFAILEVIERDALMMQWLALRSPPQIDLNTISNLDLQVLLGRLRAAGYEVTALDGRTDIPVPTIIAVIRRRDERLGAFTIGASCHFNPETAITSAVSDAAARHVGFSEKTRRSARRLRAMLADFTLVRTVRDHGALYGLPEAARHAAFLTEGPRSTYESAFEQWRQEAPRSVDLREDINWLLGILARAGLTRVLVVEQTSSEGLRAGLRTVRVLIPGALPVDFGHGRCRAVGLPRLVAAANTSGRCSTPISDRIPHPFA